VFLIGVFFYQHIVPNGTDTVAGKAIGFALEQTLRDAALAVFCFANCKTALAEK
jgi:hypothetical protein